MNVKKAYYVRGGACLKKYEKIAAYFQGIKYKSLVNGYKDYKNQQINLINSNIDVLMYH